jgi:signal transduction histidine kinase
MKVSLLLVAVVISLCSHAQLKPSSSERIEHLAKRAGDLRLSHADSAIAMAMEVRDWGKRNREYHTQVRGNLLLADIYYYKNEREKGFSYLTEALDVCEKHKMEAESIDIYYSIGLHYSRNARRPDGSSDTQTLEKALSYHTKGKKLAEKYQLPELTSKGYNLSGVCLSRLGKNEEALKSYAISESYSRDAKDSIGLGYTLDYAGTLLAEMGQFREAEGMLLEALEIRKLLKDTFAYAINLNNVGEFYARQGNRSNGISYLEQSFEISFQRQFQDLALHTAGLLSELYQAENRYDLALNLKQKEMALKDSLYSVNRARIQEEMDAKYEAELRERQLVEQELEISRRNTQLALALGGVVLLLIGGAGVYRSQRLKQRHLQTELKLKEQLAAQELQERIKEERLRLSRDLHDSLGAELTLITSTADNQAYAASAENKGSFEKIGEISRNAVNVLRDTIWAIRKDTLNAEEFALKLMQFTQQRQGNMQIVLENEIADSIQLTPSQSLHLFRVCQEAIQNAIKHAQASEMRVMLRADAQRIQIELKDNGVGIEREREGGYGLNNMRERIAEINGVLAFLPNSPQGTIVSITVPRTI